MKVITGIKNFKTKNLKRPIVVAIGNFDGVHIAHKKVIKSAISTARQLRGTSVVLTFDPHPLKVLKIKEKMPILTSKEHKLSLISEIGPDICLVANFRKQFAEKEPEYFTKNFLKQKINADLIIVGKKFNFGKDKSGDIKFLAKQGEKLGFKVKLITALKKSGVTISSTFIRNLIKNSEFRKIKSMLGRDFSVAGRVIRGDGRGRRLGFPTANIDPGQEVLPAVGVYAVEIKINDKIFKGMLNIGFRPTFYKNKKIQIMEASLFNFKRNIYNQKVEVIFKKKIRNEKIFRNIEKLKKQIEKDKKKAIKILNS
ncbi:MAG: bifunctional riboflavin kinase/FAD synthetase [Candidatus Omnitrophota bacterium]